MQCAVHHAGRHAERTPVALTYAQSIPNRSHFVTDAIDDRTQLKGRDAQASTPHRHFLAILDVYVTVRGFSYANPSRNKVMCMLNCFHALFSFRPRFCGKSASILAGADALLVRGNYACLSCRCHFAGLGRYRARRRGCATASAR
jgi:hypothetical protein